MKTTPPAAALEAVPLFHTSDLDAFEAGLKSQVPTELFPGLIAHHQDIVITDKTLLRLAEAKRSETGPKIPAGNLLLLTPESFSSAVRDHSDARSKIFADAEGSSIIAIFDFLQTGGRKPDAEEDSRSMGWGQFTARIDFKESRKVKEWRKTLEWMSQADFANFIEDHLEDVVSPSGQDLLSIATDLEASSSGGFKGKVNLQNGSVKLCYQDEVETTVEVPRTLTLGIPLFEHGDRYRLEARLRFVISGGQVRFKLLFTNLQDAKDQEFERIVQEIEEKTEVTIYRGRLALPW